MRPFPPATLVVAASIGGAVGAAGRWGLDQAWPAGDGFPWTTLLINISGSFLLALLPAFAAVRRHRVLPVLLGTGMLGGWTTLSTYAEQSRALLGAGQPLLATAYLTLTLLACVLAVHIGHHWSSRAEQAAFEVEEGNE